MDGIRRAKNAASFLGSSKLGLEKGLVMTWGLVEKHPARIIRRLAPEARHIYPKEENDKIAETLQMK